MPSITIILLCATILLSITCARASLANYEHSCDDEAFTYATSLGLPHDGLRHEPVKKGTDDDMGLMKCLRSHIRKPGTLYSRIRSLKAEAREYHAYDSDSNRMPLVHLEASRLITSEESSCLIGLLDPPQQSSSILPVYFDPKQYVSDCPALTGSRIKVDPEDGAKVRNISLHSQTGHYIEINKDHKRQSMNTMAVKLHGRKFNGVNDF